MSAAHEQPQDAAGGTYADFRRQIDDPALREALLRQVRGTVNGLRQAYAVHLAVALIMLVLVVVLSPGGVVAAWRDPLLAGLLLADLMALGGLRSVARHPARWILPLLALDLVLVLGFIALTVAAGSFHLGWLLLLIFPVTLLVYLRDARAIAPLLAEHARWRAHGGPGA